MTTVLHARLYVRFIEIQSTFRRKKTLSNESILGGSFSNRDNVRAPI